MEITIASALDGDSSGCITFQVPASYCIGNLIKLYCNEKGMEISDDYVLCRNGNSILDPLKTLEKEKICHKDHLTLIQIDKNEGLFAFGSWWKISFLALLIGCLGLAYSFYLFYSPNSIAQKYGLVIDAGSSHSQLFVFSWSTKDAQGMADVELIHDCMMTGGVAEYRSHTQDLHEYFVRCITEAEDQVPLSHQSSTPLILAATGGMRILRAFDPEGANLVLSVIREIFFSKTKFLTNHKDVFVASGQQEGINGWAALNYLMENFQAESGNETESQASALDLGGASVQVTTELSHGSRHWPTVNITIFNNTYRIFSKSFLCYGIGEAMHRYQFLLFKDKTSPNTLLNPCLPQGFDIPFTTEDFSDPCVFSNDTKSFDKSVIFPSKHAKKYTRKYMGWDDNSNNNSTNFIYDKPAINESVYMLKGSSDTKLCQKKVQRLFDYDLCKKSFVLGDCLNKKLVPPYKGEMVGFSSIFLKLLPLLGVSQDGSLGDFQDAVISICSMSAFSLRTLHPNVSEEMLEDLCFDGMYVYTLLTEGLGITSQMWKNILFTNKVHKQDVVWAMGLILNRTSSLGTQSSAAEDDISHVSSFVLLVVLFMMYILLSLMFMWYAIKMKHTDKVYQRLFTNPTGP